MTQKPKLSDQSRRFIETARELGCDEDEAAFEEKLKKIATAKPHRIAGASAPKGDVPSKKPRK